MELGRVESLLTQRQPDMTHPNHGLVSDTEQEVKDWVLETEDHERLEEEWDNVRVTYGDVTRFVAELG